ncbi:hypothetical protein FJTKL_04414 [Diaporthe vaccinii]|uniref:Uncharacterized protein n=1 Tax=Diaporthe vaccinii TaxID=105482 RepID=A0ABR4DT51_9PEZI
MIKARSRSRADGEIKLFSKNNISSKQKQPPWPPRLLPLSKTDRYGQLLKNQEKAAAKNSKEKPIDVVTAHQLRSPPREARHTKTSPDATSASPTVKRHFPPSLLCNRSNDCAKSNG